MSFSLKIFSLANIFLHVGPGLNIIPVVLHEVVVVELSFGFGDLEQFLVALAFLNTEGHLQEGDVLSLCAFVYTFSIAAKIINSMIL